jgi:hypothetical protein
MIDFSPLKDKTIPWDEFVLQFNIEDFVQETETMTAYIMEILAKATNEDVVFVPIDKDANDTFAAGEENVHIAWTLGHVIVHMTASMEEAAFMAAELARGVDVALRRSRVEVDWETITTIKQCRQRVQESHRMVMGSLAIWPDDPQLDNFFTNDSGAKIDTRRRFLYGMIHADSHYEQLKEIIRQSRHSRKIA